MQSFKDDFLARFRWIGGHADMLGLLADGAFLARAVEAVAAPFRDRGITKVGAVEARGFALGAGVALGSARASSGYARAARSIPTRKPSG